ncbi:ion transporter [Shewanella sp. NIFS-20-20]|uniref:ion transporter n=1 Tax=Shewanella sp. NIFS-20-20 TaxID=2853806 RepID=UPI001C44DA8F|nr:ion transporter [Shewanella sp. NIFS-20-20]MBV7314692.1 ion transporter [Shewanella sp. NIFS-20-20]
MPNSSSPDTAGPNRPSKIRTINTPTPFELAMMVLSLVSVILVLSITFAPLAQQTHDLLLMIDTGICFIFLANFFFGLVKARNKRFYLRHHWIDFLASIPTIEALRMMRLFQVLRVIRLIRTTRHILVPLLKQKRQTTLASLMLAMLTILTLSSLLILVMESGEPGANIITAQDALWWSLVTVSTVGYGDFYPVTSGGHVIGAIVIICGVSFFGVISGYMASVFVSSNDSDKEDFQQDIRQELYATIARLEQNQTAMMEQLAKLNHTVSQRSAAPSPAAQDSSDSQAPPAD